MLSDHGEYKFIGEWLRRVCLKGVASMNLGHDPGLRGLRAVTEYLRVKKDAPDRSDGLFGIYVSFFQPNPITGYYGGLSSFFINAGIELRFKFEEGTTFYFSVYRTMQPSEGVSPEMSELAEELAEVFVQAYNNSSSRKQE